MNICKPRNINKRVYCGTVGCSILHLLQWDFFFFCWQGRLQGWKVGNEWIGVHDVKFNQLEPIQSCKKKKKVPWTKWCLWLGLRSGIYLKNNQTNGLDNNSQSRVSILTTAKTQHKRRSTIWSSEKSANSCLLEHYSEQLHDGISLPVYQQMNE